MEQDKKDWELYPERYETEKDGVTFKLKKDGTPRKKKGRPKGSKSNYNYHSKTKAKMNARKSMSKKKKRIKQLQGQINSYKSNLKKQKEVYKKLDNVSDNQVILDTEIKELIPSVQKEIQDKPEENVVFHPNDGPQTEFLAAGEKDVLYGGAAGGGKSYAMLVDPLRYAHKSAHRALILRRSMPELRELIDKSRELYPKAFPGCKFREVEKLWNFPSGAKIEFGFLERDADVYRYQGQAYSWIGFDEITHLPTEFGWNYLASIY